MSEAETIVPVMFFLIVVGLPVTGWIVSRVLHHQERMEMLRRGFTPPPDPRMMRNAVKYGAKGWAPGTVPPPGWHPPGAYDPAYYAQAQLRRGIQVACIGFALLIGLSFIGFHDGRYIYGPWLLGGLIPMFVGIAQIISAVLSGAQITPLGSSAANAHFGPAEHGGDVPSAPAGGPNVPPPPPGSYGGWRPGTTPEIEKPAGPPERF
ncbi:MAG: hypothetical protein WB615_07100 [Candidatus Tumulicola sp.]